MNNLCTHPAAPSRYICAFIHKSSKRAQRCMQVLILIHTYTVRTSTHIDTHSASVNCWFCHERDPLIEDNRTINLTLLIVWRGLPPLTLSVQISITHTSLGICVFISWLLPRSHPLSHILCLVVCLLTVWWRHRWKHCLAETLKACVWHRHARTHAHRSERTQPHIHEQQQEWINFHVILWPNHLSASLNMCHSLLSLWLSSSFGPHFTCYISSSLSSCHIHTRRNTHNTVCSLT